jgi:hypothetical protein
MPALLHRGGQPAFGQPVSSTPANGVWSPLLPTERMNHSAIYDPVRDRMLRYHP